MNDEKERTIKEEDESRKRIIGEGRGREEEGWRVRREKKQRRRR